MTRKIRIIATALTAALTISFAGATFTETASAGKNTNRYQSSGEKKRKETLGEKCSRLQGQHKAESALADGLAKVGDLDGARATDDEADDTKEKAGHLGCGWALRKMRQETLRSSSEASPARVTLGVL